MNNGKMIKRLPRICFFGCGYITAKHSKLLKKLFPEIELSYAGVEPAEAIQYRDRFKGASAFDTYREAAQSDAFDIAYIATPHAFHAELAVLAAENGKDLIIEKPIARNLKELSAIERAVKRNRVRCTMAENYLYKPFIGKVRKYIDDGFIGEVLCIELNKTNRDTVTGWRTDAELMGGGALLEGGVHWVNLLVSLAASHPQEVVAFKPDVRYDTSVPFEDTVLLTVQFQSGVIGKLLHSWRIPNTLQGVRLSKIYGSEGVITFESNGLFLWVAGRKTRVFINPIDFLGFRGMHRAFIDKYMRDEPWEPSLERIRRELQLIELAYRSFQSKRVERIT